MATNIYQATKDGAQAFIKLNLPIGTIYENKFNIDMSLYFVGTWERYANGEVLVGVNESDNTFSTSDKSVGEKTHTLTVAEMPSHSHRTGISGERAGDMNEGQNSAYVYFDQNMGMLTTATGGSQPHNNIQPSRTVYRWIRVS